MISSRLIRISDFPRAGSEEVAALVRGECGEAGPEGVAPPPDSRRFGEAAPDEGPDA